MGRVPGLDLGRGLFVNLIHPGKVLFHEEMRHRGLTLADAERALGLSKAQLGELSSGRSRITPELADKLERWLGADTGSTAAAWLTLQQGFDLWEDLCASRPR